MRLTERKVEQLSPEPGRKDRLVFDDAQRGLAVRVTASGGRTYLCQHTMHGRKWRVPLGSCSAVSLANAREAAAAVMGDVAKGRNPAAERKADAAAERARRARNRLTLRVLIEDWKRIHLAARRPSYAAEAVRALHYAFANCLDDPAEDLDRAAVVRARDALTRRRKRKDVLNHISRSRGGIAGVYQRHDWAAEKRAALDAWATHVRSIVEGGIDGTNVVKMPRNADTAKQSTAIVGGPYYAYIRLPKLFEACQNLRASLSSGPLSQREQQIVNLIVARHWNARYPWFAQVRRSLAIGIEQAVIDAINPHGNPSLADAREHTWLLISANILRRGGGRITANQLSPKGALQRTTFRRR